LAGLLDEERLPYQLDPAVDDILRREKGVRCNGGIDDKSGLERLNRHRCSTLIKQG